MSFCLTRDEVAELTNASTRKRQIAFLQKNGIRHYIDLGGWPVVMRASVEATPESAQDRPKWKPGKAA